MPQRQTTSGRAHSSRRRYLLMLLLVPATGCALPTPWTSEPLVGQSAKTDPVVGAEKKPVFQMAAYRAQGQEDSADLVDTADALLDSTDPADESLEALPPPVIDAVATPTSSEPQVIDLASALGMAGGNAWTIHLARQRTVEAHADLNQARALWLPSLQFGVGWNKHDGRIQATPGDVIEASRSSLFVGAGATLGNSPVAGGSGGPLRLFADLALADAYFAPKIAGRQVSARKADVVIAKNQALLDAGLAYVNLLEATAQVADANVAIAAAGELLNLTRTFAEAGAGAQADVDRAATEQARLAQLLHNANRLYRTRSANLSRRLRLDPRFVLHPADQAMMPIELSSDATDVDTLIASALGGRPEINALSHDIAGLCLAVQQAQVDPWIPRVAMTSSAGNFGGGNGSDLDNQAGRSDVDLQAVWQIESLGLGVAARRSRAASQLAQRRIELADLRDEISAQVVAAYEDVLNYRAQIESANEAMRLAEASYERNLQRVRADEGLPIELLQAINARAGGLRDRTAAVANYNRAQLQLLHAAGQLRQ